MRSAYFTVLLFLAVSAAANYLPQAHARASPDVRIPNAQVCFVPAGAGGGVSQAAEQRIGPSPFAAQATWGAGRRPTITYSPQYFSFPATMQVFLSLHECGHLVLKTTNEFRANCFAVARGEWSTADLDRIGRTHEALGSLGPQYGSSGAAFWAETKRTCPQYFG